MASSCNPENGTRVTNVCEHVIVPDEIADPADNRAYDPAADRLVVGDGNSDGALAGVRVLDLTSVVMGPFATQMLGDIGADVIAIEDRRGDTNRSMGAGPTPDLSGVSLNLMRNKRSVGLDLKDSRGRAAALRMAESSDIMVTNLRPGPLGRLGLTYDDVRAVRPDIVFCQAHGYPSDSADADAPAYDDIIQSASGVGDLFARQGHEPALFPTLVADKVCGLTIVSAVLAALYHRSITGEGQRIEIPMIDVMRSFVLVEHGAQAIPEPPIGPPGYERILTPERRPQHTDDGWINVLPYTADHYRRLFRLGGREDLVDDERIRGRAARIANSDSLYRDVAAILGQRTTEQWLELCREEGIPATRAASLEDLVDELPLAEHPTAGAFRVIPPPARYSATPAAVRRPAPTPGEHGREVLGEVGYDDAELDDLARDGVLFGGGDPGPSNRDRH
ncbi:MAG: CoA transferase [Acidimicrobiia bacterium]|nr:CoA transferase [Acidimicrobiia bacterium]